MDCRYPEPLTDDDLNAILDGLADSTQVEHLANCPACAARYQALRQFDARLSAALERFECPPSQTLADYAFNLLAPFDAAVVQAHLTVCARCNDELAMLNAFADEATAAPPGPQLVERPASSRIVRPPRDYWRAELIEQQGQLAAVRGMGQALYDVRARSATVYIEAQRAMAGVMLSGQVIDAVFDWTGALAELWQGGALNGVRVLDSMCEFQFQLPEAKPISLYITAPGGTALALEFLQLT